MMAGRGARWLGWTALFLGAVIGELRAQADGTLRWALSTGNTGSTYVVSSPTVGPDGTVFFGVEQKTNPKKGYVFALNRDASRKWQFDLPDWVDSTPTLSADGTLYFGCWDGKLYALNAETGAKKWDYSAGSYVLSSPAIGPNGTIYFGGGDSALHAVSAAGVRLWTFQTGYPIIESSPAVASDGTVYFGSIDRNVYALSPEGNLKWRFATSSSVTSSPSIGLDGTVYVGSYDGSIYALDPNTGGARWKFETKGRVTASPVLGADGVVYCGSEDSFFYAINPDGTLKWSVSVGYPIVSSAAVRSDGTVIFGADDGLVRALYTSGIQAGVIKWVYKTGDIVESSPVVANDGTIYVGSLDGKLYSFSGSGAAASEYSSWPMFRRSVMRSGSRLLTGDGGRLVNLATRAQAGGDSTLIAGLVTKGAGPKDYLIRAVGPSLSQLGVTNALRDPSLSVRSLASEAVLLANDDWGVAENLAQIRAATSAVGAFPLLEESKDSVVLGSLVPGAYTAALKSSDSVPAVALIEAYDTAVDSAASRLINLSTRAFVGTGDRVLIPGLVIGGTDVVRVLVRAIGPGLTAFGVTGVLARPTMTVFSSDSSVILTNTGWSSTAQKGDIAGAAVTVGAFPLVDGSADCAALLTLNPGRYTIQVSGVGGTTGEALVEVYALP